MEARPSEAHPSEVHPSEAHPSEARPSEVHPWVEVPRPLVVEILLWEVGPQPLAHRPWVVEVAEVLSQQAFSSFPS